MDELLYKMRKGFSKKGQQSMSLPFGMIFAIFMIIVFVVIAFVAVRGFLDVGKTAEVGMFYRDLQDAVDNAMSEQSTKFNFTIDLPPKITSVCFANLTSTITKDGLEHDAIEDYKFYNANVFLVPPEYTNGMEYQLIEGLDIEEITKNENPYCVNVNDKLKINKEFFGKLVWVERA